MKFFSIIKQSLGAIMRNKGRSFLTVLGIIIGIGSVIALISMGQGVKDSVTKQINQLGSNKLTITSGSVGTGVSGSQSKAGVQGGSKLRNGSTATLTPEDLTSLSDRVKHPLIKTISGQVAGSTIFTISEVEQRYSVLGVSLEYFNTDGYHIATGSSFTSRQLDNKEKVAVLGQSLASELFGNESPINKTITVAGQSYMVVGLMEKVSETSYNDPNEQVYIPYTNAFDAFDISAFSDFSVEAIDEKSIDNLKQDITTTLLSNHNITNSDLADFSVLTSADLLSTVSSVTGLLTSLLAGIAAISLVVGGIGIMNIMLVAVTERTREIGLRKAVGAKTSDILWQFIIEAVLLTLLGGLLGIVLGFAIGKIASHYIGFSAVITASSVALAVGVSSAVGLVFGVYPAARAARLNPIDALRYE